MPAVTFTNHLAVQHVQRCKQRGGAVALVEGKTRNGILRTLSGQAQVS
jgi:hypothetical protein